MSNRIVHILMGLPGSGKSYWASRWARQLPATVVSTDLFFSLGEGDYKFEQGRIGEAHQWCYNRFMTHLVNDEREDIIVDNTNLKQEYRAPYIAAAQAKKRWDVRVHVFHIDILTAIDRNTHGVPPDVIENMFYGMDKPRGVFGDVKVLNYYNGVARSHGTD